MQKKNRWAKNDLTDELGRNLNQDELVSVLPFKCKDMTFLEQYEKGDTIKLYIGGEIQDAGSLFNSEFDNYALKKIISEVMKELTKTMKIIVNLSEERICQLHAKAIDLLKSHLDKKKN